MLNVCPACRDPSVEKTVRPEGTTIDRAVAACRSCGHEFQFTYLPLYTLEGVPGVGKSTTAGLIEDDVPLAVYEGDHLIDLLGGELSWDAICDLELRIGMTLHANGRQALYVGGMYPHDLEESAETRYFPAIERCALVCSDDDLTDRLRARDFYRTHPDLIEDHLEQNRWYRDSGHVADVHFVNTTERDPRAVAEEVKTWISDRLGG